MDFNFPRVYRQTLLWWRVILRLPDAKIQLIVKDPDAGKDWAQEEKGVTEDESKLWEIVKYREVWHAAVHGVAKIWT